MFYVTAFALCKVWGWRGKWGGSKIEYTLYKFKTKEARLMDSNVAIQGTGTAHALAHTMSPSPLER